MVKKWIDVVGSVEIDCSADEFDIKFLEFIESNGWSFVGRTVESEGDD